MKLFQAADGVAQQVGQQAFAGADQVFQQVRAGQGQRRGDAVQAQLVELHVETGVAQIGPQLLFRVVGGHEVPLRLVVGLAERVERLAGGVIEHVAVGQQVQTRVQRQRLAGGGVETRQRALAVLGPGAGVQVVGFAGAHVVRGLQQLTQAGAFATQQRTGVDRLEQLGHAAGHEYVAVRQGHHGRVPAAVIHVAGLGPAVVFRVEDTSVFQAFQLHHADVVGHADFAEVTGQRELGIDGAEHVAGLREHGAQRRLGVVVGAAHRHDAAVGELDHVGTEQGAVVAGGAFRVAELGAGQQGVAVVAVHVGAAANR